MLTHADLNSVWMRRAGYDWGTRLIFKLLALFSVGVGWEMGIVRYATSSSSESCCALALLVDDVCYLLLANTCNHHLKSYCPLKSC